MSLRFHQVRPEAEVCYPGASTVTRTVRLVKADCHKRLQQKDLDNAVHAAGEPNAPTGAVWSGGSHMPNRGRH